jgi:hypothetical protein
MRTFPLALVASVIACGGGTTPNGLPDVKPVVLGDLGTGTDAPAEPGTDPGQDAKADSDATDLTADGAADAPGDAPGDAPADTPGDAPAADDLPSDVPCLPGPAYCDDNRRVTCGDAGVLEYEDCGELMCIDGKCLTCPPGVTGCQGFDVAKCTDDGSAWFVTESCDPDVTGNVCKEGKCVNQCEAAGPRTNAGCEYWPLDLDQNYEYEAENMQFAVIVSNVSGVSAANVKVFKDGLVEKEVTVPKNDLTIILLDPYNIDTAGVAAPEKLLSRRLTSTSPIIAYQFNPLENVNVFSNDASLLLPTNSLGKVYRVMSWRQRADEIASYFTVVPVDEGATLVTITVTAPTAPGVGLDALPAGGSTQVTLQQGQVLHVKGMGGCIDLTGSLVEADKRVEVLGGHECANVPLDASCGSLFCCCDHLEDQMFPVDTWGKHYVVAHLFPRGQAQDTIRVLAAMPNTSVTVTGASVTVPTLNEGQFFDFRITSDVEVSSEEPILVAQLMEGQTSPTGCSETCDEVILTKKCDGNPFGKVCETDEDCCPGVAGIGDPALILSVPVEQFREDYVFLVPTKYAKNYINVIAPAGATVTLDDAVVPSSSFSTIGSGLYAAARMPVAEGVHRISSPSKINVVVYGWDQYVSYGYAGGMNVNTLTGM